MSENQININLNEFADGALAERLNEEIQKVIRNIADPNTDPKKARRVTCSLTFKPSGRNISSVIIDVKSTLLQSIPVETEMLIDYTAGGAVGYELKSGAPGQLYFDDKVVRTDTGEVVSDIPESSEKVVQFK